MVTYVAPIAPGLGDLIVCLPVVQALIEGGETALVMRSPLQVGLSERIPGLRASIREPDFQPEALAVGDRFLNLREHPLQRDHIWGSPEFEEKYPGYRINDVLSGICADWKIAADFARLKPLSFSPRREAEGTVLFIPGSTGPVKCWPAEHWMALRSELSRQGREVIVVGQPERSAEVKHLVDHGVRWLPTPTLVDALDVISSAAAAVSVDTGLMHLAVHQGKPVVALFRNNSMFYRPYPNCRGLFAQPCDSRCTVREFSHVPNLTVSFNDWQEVEGSWYWRTWDCATDPSKHCMTGIAPASVLACLNERLTAKP